MFTEQLQWNGLSLRLYSGRGMYGRACTGIIGHRSTIFKAIGEFIAAAHKDVLSDLADVCEDDEAGLAAVSARSDEFMEFSSNLLAGFQQDNMGFDTVVYWPDWEYKEEPVDESPEDE